MAIWAQRVVYSILFYVLALCLIIVAKPSFIFDTTSKEACKKPKPFGVGEGKSLYSLGVVTVALAVVSFYIFALIDMISCR